MEASIVTPAPEVLRLKALLETSLDADKAEDIVSIDLAGKTSLADYMIIATGRSQRHIAALADHLIDKLRGIGYANVPVEGQQQGDWVVVDAGDIIIHLFRPEVRPYYNLEKMWSFSLPAEEAMA
jgi:ribosome-associated protein